MSSKLIYLIRHGETEFNRLGIVQGSGVDAPLNETGHWQAQAFFQKYRHIPFELVLTSHLQRTHQTVQPFLDLGMKWEKTSLINEIGWGMHEGKISTPATHSEYKSVVNDWSAGNYHAKIEGGESALELQIRLERFIHHLAKRAEERILVCSHGRAMRGLICLMKGLPIRQMEEFKHSNTGLYLLRHDGNEFAALIENDNTHVKDWELATLQNL